MEEKNVTKQDIEFHYERATQKAKNNLVWFGIFSIVMLFSGFTSAYIVSKGDGFWVNFNIPKAFWISTILILISSITVFLAVRSAKKQNRKQTTLFVLTSLLLGIAFGVFQYQGWNEVNEKGMVFSGKIYNLEKEEFNIKGEYGKDYIVEFQGNPLIKETDGFYFWGEDIVKVNKKEYEELKSTKPEMAYGKDFVRVQIKKGKSKRKIFQVVVLAKKKLSVGYLAKLKDAGNNSSSYFYIITALHLLHFIFAIGYLFKLLITLVTAKNKEIHYQRIRRTGYFWHFFGGLWMYLLLFLFFIH
jgi:heme/copper-type cytochrome/quinol oxidase subunit 3